MAFNAGAVVGTADLNTQGWNKGVKNISTSSIAMGNILADLAVKGFDFVAKSIVNTVKASNEYQKQFRNVSTLTNQNTKSLQQMSIGLLSISSELGTTTELTRSMYDAISAGAKPGKDALDVVTSSAKFAKAALADNAASVKLLSATTNAYGKDVISSERAADVFFTTIKQGVITGEELSATIGQSIPLFASMNIPVEQLASGMAAMTKQGVGASEATTQLNAIVNSFLKPSERLNEILKEQGFESGQAFIQAEGLTGALELLRNATENGDAQISELTTNTRALRGVLALSGEGAKNYNETLKEMATASGAVDTAFQKQEKTFATFQNEAAKSQIIIGNIAKFFVDDLASGAQQALEAINQFIIGGRGLQAVSNIMGKVGAVFNVIKTVATEVYELFKDNLNETIEDLQETFNDLFDISVDQNEVFGKMSDAVNVLGGALNIVVALVKVTVENFMRLVKVGLNTIDVIGNLWDVLAGRKSLSDVKDALGEVKDSVIDMGKAYIDNIVNVVEVATNEWNKLTKNSEDNSKKFADAWEDGTMGAKNAVQNNYMAAVSGVKNGSQDMADANEEAMKKIVKDTKQGNKDASNANKQGTEKSKSAWQSWKDFVEENLKTTMDKIKFWGDQVLELFNITFSGLSDVTSLYYQNEIDKLTLQQNQRLEQLQAGYDAEMEALTARFERGLITEEQYNEQSNALTKKYETDKNGIEKEALAKSNDIAKKQFETQQALNIAQLWVDAARAVLGFWAWGAPIGPPGWAVAGTMTGVVTALAVAKTALIANQQFIPQYAEGTRSHPGGLARVNEEGGEIIDLPTGSRVIPHDLSEQMINNNNNMVVNVNNPVVREENDINKIVNAVSRMLGRQMRLA